MCNWTHGQEFVFCASQNTMTALINGVTLHSFFNLAFKGKDGKSMNVRNNDKADMSPHYVKFQALRYIFIDEFSTAAIEIFTEINNLTCRHIRSNNTWSLRKQDDTISDRPFGGLNMVVSGDAWQFGPIGSCGAVFDNPTRLQCSSAHETIAAMFSIQIMEPRQWNCLWLEIWVEPEHNSPGIGSGLNTKDSLTMKKESSTLDLLLL